VQFLAGQVSFDRAMFGGGQVSFDAAEFSGAQVSFGGARFSGGEVDFSGARDWSVPPAFDWPADSPPQGVKLPGKQDQPQP